jgi:TldD protein
VNETLCRTIQELLSDFEKRFPYASALWMKTEGTQASLNSKDRSLSALDPNAGIVFTVFTGTAFEEFATSEVEGAELAQAVKRWASELPQHQKAAKPFDLQEVSESRTFVTPVEIDPAILPAREKFEVLQSLQGRLQGLDRRVLNAIVGYGDSSTRSIFLRPSYTLDQTLKRTITFLELVVHDNEQMQYAYVPHSGTGGFEITRFSDEELDRLKEDALHLLQAEPMPPGDYEVVTDNSTAGVIAHECFGHGVELDLFPKKRARSAQYIGKRVAAPGVNMFDDPGYAGAYGSYFFDDEGMLARSTQILEDGVLINPLTDLSSILALPTFRRTANGRRESFARKAYARMSNTFFGTGSHSPSDMLEGLEDGIYLRNAISGMEDPLGWGVQVTVHIGEEYKHGKPTGRIFSPVGISGYVPDLLASISAIGHDMELEGGFCGKGHKENIPVTTGGPHLRLRARLG